ALAVALVLGGVLLALAVTVLAVLASLVLGLAALALVAGTVLALADQLLGIVADVSLVLGDLLAVATSHFGLGPDAFLLADNVLQLFEQLLHPQPFGLQQLGTIVGEQDAEQRLQVLAQALIELLGLAQRVQVVDGLG